MSKPLLQKNTRFLLTWLPVVLLACSVLFFVMLQMQAHHMQEKQLLLKQTNVWNAFIAESGNMVRDIRGEYDIAEQVKTPAFELDEPRDTAVYYPLTREILPFKALTGRLAWHNRPYLVTTYVSSKEITHLIIKVYIAEACILLLLLVAIIILNRKSSAFLWKPFFSTMQKINGYDITRSHALVLPEQTGTDEFDKLNGEINYLVTNVNAAYNNQKQFVENASHEMQTPLAIIRSKLELLINQPGINEHVAVLLADITDANNRLSQMNRTLLLLAKIENNQFPEKEPTNIAQILRQTIDVFSTHYENFPEIATSIEDKVILNVNLSLMEILVSNLVKNAIEHNNAEAKMKIVLSSSGLLIANTGNPLQVNPEALFGRFTKGYYKTKTTGLGLALVKQICNLYGFRVSYTYSVGWHVLEVIFS
ncbi:MAG TPA: HAMP domain-containing sensor histidine kinase [Chitinophagaceae bacterium]|nr:HAMP domain-containing sensor histidine kinase [Chitinophagaceae bacterium]